MRLVAPSWAHSDCKVTKDATEWWKWVDQMCLNGNNTETKIEMLEPISRIQFADFEVAVPYKMKLWLQNMFGNNLNAPYGWDTNKQKYFKLTSDYKRHGTVEISENSQKRLGTEISILFVTCWFWYVW